jgi:hypothetical protein
VTYPVVSEHVLDPVGGRWFKRRRREDMPQLLPGTVYVLRVLGVYRQYPEGVVFDPGHDDVLDASCVSLVDTRTRVVEVRRTLPSVSEADQFTVSVSFSCQVTDPELVARHGVVDVTAPLGAYLAAEDELPRTTSGFRVEEINAVRAAAADRMIAHTTVNPPRVAGMQVEFVGTEVFAAENLRDWEQELRQQRRNQELQQGRHDFESRQTQQIAELLALGPLYAEVLHMVRDGVDMAEIVGRINATAAQEQARRAQAEDDAAAHARDAEGEAFRLRRDLVLGLLQRLDSDGDALFSEELLDVLIRQMAPPDGTGPALTAGSSQPADRSRSASRPGRPGRPRGDGAVRNEDDLAK